MYQNGATPSSGGRVLISQATESSEIRSDELDRTMTHREHAASEASSGIKQAKESNHMPNHTDHWMVSTVFIVLV